MIRRNNGEKSAKLFAGISMIVFSIIFCSILVCMVNMRQGGNSIIMKEDIIADIDNGIILEEFDDEFDDFDDFDEFSYANNAFNFVQIIFLLVGVGIFVIGIVLVVSALKKRDDNANDSYFNGVNMNSYYNTNMNHNMNSNMNPNMNTNMNPNMNYNTNTQYNMNDNYRMNDYQNNNQNNTYILNGKKYSKDKNSLDI